MCVHGLRGVEMTNENTKGPGPLIWVVILLAAVAGGIWGIGAALSVGVATTALFTLIGMAMEKSASLKRQRIQSDSDRRLSGSTDNSVEDDPEILYYQAIEDYLKDRGIYYDLVLPAQCIDEFMGASSKVYKAGYNSGMSPKVVGALIADAAKLYDKNPSAALAQLQGLEKKIRERNQEEVANFADVESQEDIEPQSSATKAGTTQLSQFMLDVKERLREGPAGDSLHQIDQSFRRTSPEYLKVTTELFQTAIDLGKSPTEVSTYLIMAFAAAREASALEPSKRVTVYLRGVIDYLRSSD
jgi:hypothetical protein